MSGLMIKTGCGKFFTNNQGRLSQQFLLNPIMLGDGWFAIYATKLSIDPSGGQLVIKPT